MLTSALHGALHRLLCIRQQHAASMPRSIPKYLSILTTIAEAVRRNDADRPSLTQNTRTSGNAVHGRIQDEVDRPAGGDGAAPAAAASSDASQEGNINVARLMGSVEYGRPLAQGARVSALTGYKGDSVGCGP